MLVLLGGVQVLVIFEGMQVLVILIWRAGTNYTGGEQLFVILGHCKLIVHVRRLMMNRRCRRSQQLYNVI